MIRGFSGARVVVVFAAVVGIAALLAPASASVSARVVTSAYPRLLWVRDQAGVGRCVVSDVKIAESDNPSIGDGELAGMSHVDSVWTFTNTGHRPCFLQGYPGITGVDGAGRVLFRATPTPDGAGPRVQLAPGAKASTELSGNTASCDHVTTVPTMWISAPGEKTATHIPWGPTLCLTTITVAPVTAGDTAGLNYGG